MASYPGSVWAPTTKNTNDTIQASHINDPQSEIVAVEGALLNGVAHNLIPDAASTRDLGSSTKPWNNVYVTNLNSGFNGFVEGRLTLTTATPVTTSDVTAATTLYFTPYRGNRLSLYDGSAVWNILAFSELSIAVPATTSQMYDIFVYNNAGTATLELLAWTNDTTRATALTTQNGVLVKTGATTRRYLGSFRTTGVAGQTEDSAAKRYLWNYYNRLRRALLVVDTTNSWASSGTSLRQANGAAANQVDVVVGVAEVLISLRATLAAFGAASYATSIGEDVTNAKATGVVSNVAQAVADGSAIAALVASLDKYPAIGRHFYAWLEVASAASTFIGDNGTTSYQSGLTGWIEG